MTKYAVSYISFFDNELVTVFVDSTSEIDALNKGLVQMGRVYEGETGFDDCQTLDEACERAMDCDSMVNVAEVPK